MYALLYLKNFKGYKTSSDNWDYEISSIRSQTGIWIFTVSIIAAFIFFSVYSLFAHNIFFFSQEALKVLLLVLILYSVFSVLISRIFTDRLCSPLTALQLALHNATNIEDKPRQVIYQAAKRINDIADSLLDRYRSSKEADTMLIKPELLIAAIEEILLEKRTQFASRDIEFYFEIGDEAHSLFAVINLEIFKRMVSNILNNAVEAIKNSGRVIIKLYREHNKLKLEVIDDGCGIAPELIAKILPAINNGTKITIELPPSYVHTL